MAEKLTNEQRAAVENRGRSLLVSAAAGSGKTKVLVERLFSMVAEGANIDDFLIITYTRAAASELRGKIAKALTQRLEQSPNDTHLQRQMLRVYRADIKTVDAFCTTLLRENCHLLSDDAAGHALKPDFRVLDENEAETLKERTLARVLDKFYEDITDGGVLLADTLGAGRDDSALAELVLELHTKLQAQPYQERWIAAQRKLWQEMPEKIDETPYGKILLSGAENKAHHWAYLLGALALEMDENEALSAKYSPAFREVSAQLSSLADAAKQGWDKARAAEVTFPRLTAVKAEVGGTLQMRAKSLWASCKKAVGSITESLDLSSEEAAGDLRTMAPAMTALLDLTEAFSAAYQQEKHRRNLADFSDVEHEAIRLLVLPDGTPSELALTVSARYREIMVDEYQDTNEVQNRIFEAISCQGKNLFTVGDVKQSIYRFRLADPGIFLEHYRSYPNAAEASEGESGKILLSKNFRSRREVLEATNFVFSNVLSQEMGELDYGEEEKLVTGASYEDDLGYETEFHLLALPTQSGEIRVRAAEAEANFVAGYISDMIARKFPVRDEKSGEMRPVSEDDIVILMRSPRTRLGDYRRALESHGLHCAAEESSEFYGTMEIAVLLSLLEIIDNPRQDVPLISVLRSPLFAFTPDRLAEVRAKAPKDDFYDALCADESDDSVQFLTLLRELREEALYLSVHELLFEIYLKCNVLGVFGAMPDGEEKRENLIALLSLAESFEQAGHRGLFSFVVHLREVLQSENRPTPQIAHSASGVRIMSIHKSKGLEFPVVILADLAKRFNNMDFQSSVLVHPTLGLGPICVDTKRRIKFPTVARAALERTLKRETKAEELRLLYVAMTRAKEKLVLVHTQGNAEKRISDLLATTSLPVLPEAVDEGKCLGDWVMLPLLNRPEAGALRELADADFAANTVPDDNPWGVYIHDGLAHGKTGNLAEQGRTVKPELPFDKSALSYKYPHLRETLLPAKLTATQLKGRLLDAEISENTVLPPRLRSLEKPKFLMGEKKLGGADRGTAIHLVMQYLDFSAVTEREVCEQVECMRSRRLLTQEQADAVDTKAIAAFAQSELAARLRASNHIEREYRFSLLRPIADYVEGTTSGDELLLQGVVDCFFEENGELVVIDFKTDRISASQTVARAEEYRPQLTAYAEALEKIMGKRVKEKALYFFTVGETVKL